MTMTTTRKTTSCPNCGTKADGNFCQSCGATLVGAKCPKCGTSVQAGAKFCHNCSAKLGGRAGSQGSPIPWIVAAALVVVLVIVGAVSLLPPTVPPTSVAFPAPVVPQTPRAIADENFNQSMMAHERGDITGVASFGQRALDGTLVQADSVELAIPGHLYASILRQRVHEIRGDLSGVDLAYSRFLEYYQREVDAGRPEYNEHTRMIDTFLAAASSVVRRP